MERLNITKDERGLHIEGFPDAVKAIRILDAKGRRLSDLLLHDEDLQFAAECLSAINDVADERAVIRQALWRSAIVHYVKCFGRSRVRFALDAGKVYRQQPKAAMASYRFFVSLRNKHLIHDENSYAQCLPTAVLNREGVDHRIAKVIGLRMVADTFKQSNYDSLHRLIRIAREWVVEQLEHLFTQITAELEAKPYNELLAMEGISYDWPEVDAVHQTRSRELSARVPKD